MRPIIVPSKYPTYNDTRYDNREVENSPVNVTVCHGIRKPSTKAVNQFSIHFVGTDIYWNFNVEEQRDDEFKRILRMFPYHSIEAAEDPYQREPIQDVTGTHKQDMGPPPIEPSGDHYNGS